MDPANKHKIVSRFKANIQQRNVDDTGKAVQMCILVNDTGAPSSTMRKWVSLFKIFTDGNLPQVAFVTHSANSLAACLTKFKAMIDLMKERSCYSETVEVTGKQMTKLF